MEQMNGSSMNGHATTAAPAADDDLMAAEFARLQTDLVSAKERLETARTRLSGRDRALQEALRAELAEAQEMLAQLDRTHQAAIAKIHADAQAEVDRILSEARAADGAESDEAPNVR
jgi:F0F1-type ATP synthase membrane subunit b/b'